MIMLLNASIGSADPEGKLHGAYSLATSAEPLLDGFRVIYGGDLATVLSLLAVIGLIASFHTIIFAFGRQILFAVTRRLLPPRRCRITHGTRKTPHIALFTGAALGLAVIIMAVWFWLGARARRLERSARRLLPTWRCSAP